MQKILEMKKTIKIKIIFPLKVKFVASKYNNVRLLHNFLRQVLTRLTLILTRAGSIGLDNSASLNYFCVSQPSINRKKRKNIVMIFFLDTTYRKKLLPKYIETLH